VDVLWMDIEWSDQNSQGDYNYFVYNPQNFTAPQIEQLNLEIEKSHRRITVIVDPHIQKNSDYKVYADGKYLQKLPLKQNNITNIFIKTPRGNRDYVGWCWPGDSVWIDFLNENA
jgi:alpha 1,3-glucosidase